MQLTLLLTLDAFVAFLFHSSMESQIYYKIGKIPDTSIQLEYSILLFKCLSIMPELPNTWWYIAPAYVYPLMIYYFVGSFHFISFISRAIHRCYTKWHRAYLNWNVSLTAVRINWRWSERIVPVERRVNLPILAGGIDGRSISFFKVHLVAIVSLESRRD